MPLISAGKAPASEPLVSVRAPNAHSGQRTIAFNKVLATGPQLAGVTYVAIDLDVPSGTMRFIPSKATYKGVRAHRLVPDGGRAQNARVVFVRSELLEGVPTDRYPPTIEGNTIVVRWQTSPRRRPT